VQRQLIVEPEGIEQEYSKGSFVCPQNGNMHHSEHMELTVPDNVVEGSARGFFTVVGDVMGPALSGLDKLIRLPTGCGEQNMLKFAPNIYVLQYLRSTNQLQPKLKAKAIDFLPTGYQRELTYRHADGSYSAFGDRDPEGSTWLTAFVLKSFAQAQEFITIDSDDLDRSRVWLEHLQLENGCFPRVGKVLHKGMKGDLSEGGEMPATLTAYVLSALLAAGTDPTSSVIQNGLLCIHSQPIEQDIYTLSQAAYAYSLYDPLSQELAQIMDQLDQVAVNENV